MQNIFGSSLEALGYPQQSLTIFRNFWKMLGNISLAFGQLLENLQKSLVIGQKSSENCQKHFVLR